MKMHLIAVSFLSLVAATTQPDSRTSSESHSRTETRSRSESRSRSDSYYPHEDRSSRSSALTASPTTVSPRSAEAALPGKTTLRSFSDYSAIAQHNIFVKDRYAIRSSEGTGATTAPTTQAVAATQERVMILTGIIDEDGGYHAYIEDPPSGTVLRLAVGDAVAHGTIGAIVPEAIAYDQNGQRTWVMVGDDLTGHPAGEDAYTSSTSAGASTMPSGIAGLNPNDPTLTMEQKMKLRRLQQLQH